MDPAQETVKSGDGSGIAALAQLHPEDHQTGVRVPAAHILDELDLRPLYAGLDGCEAGESGQQGIVAYRRISFSSGKCFAWRSCNGWLPL